MLYVLVLSNAEKADMRRPVHAVTNRAVLPIPLSGWAL